MDHILIGLCHLVLLSLQNLLSRLLVYHSIRLVSAHKGLALIELILPLHFLHLLLLVH